MAARNSETLISPGEEPIEKIIIRSMSEGVITLECTGRVFTVNPAALRILGFEREQLEGRPFDEAFSNDEFNDEFRQAFSAFMLDARWVSGKEVQYRRPDGQIADLAVSASCLEFDACVPGMQSVVVVFRDVTAFKSLDRMKRRAINHLSHELRTPLAVIAASIENLAGAELPRQKLLKNLERIQRNLKRLTDVQGIVEEMLNPPDFHPEPILLGPTVEDVLDRLRRDCSHRRVKVTSLVMPDSTDILDPSIIGIVLETLVKNAVEATPDGGEVIVSVDRVEAGIIVKVEDRGVGIPLPDQEFIFDGFHHTQPTAEYSSKKPYDFNAGGKGLELLRLKTMAEAGYFEISFTSDRCRRITESTRHCRGDISSCLDPNGLKGCRDSGGTTFSVLFRSR
jgi:PAS domain S-box-containing protein